MKKIDRVGKRFGRLLVIGSAPSRRAPSGEKRPYWKCRCDCGQEKEIHASSLCNGTTNSCGCLARESITRSGKNCPRWRGGKTRNKDGYIRVTVPGTRPGTRRRVFEHVLVMEKQLGRALHKDETVHHKYGIRDDNRIENLELWVSNHPAGQRTEDLVVWAKEILSRYRIPIVSPCCV